MKPKIYSTSACPFCERAREFFRENAIEFEEVNVLEDEKARDEMIRKSGQMSVPVIEIDRSGEIVIIVGFDREKLKKAMGL